MNWLKEHLTRILKTTLLLDQRLLWWKRLICILISILLLVIIPLLFGHVVTRYLDDMAKVVKVTASVGQTDLDGLGYFLPLKVLNLGEKDLQLNKIEVSTCYEISPITYYPNVVIPRNGGEYVQKIHSGALMSRLLKKGCYEEINVTSQLCSLYTFKINKTTMMVPPTNCSAYVCGACMLSIKIETNLKNETIQTSIYGAKEIPLIAYSYNYEPSTFTDKNNLGEVGLQFFAPKEQCVYYHTCANNYENSSNLPEESLLSSDRPLNLTIAPNRNTTGLEEVSDLTVLIKPR